MRLMPTIAMTSPNVTHHTTRMASLRWKRQTIQMSRPKNAMETME